MGDRIEGLGYRVPAHITNLGLTELEDRRRVHARLTQLGSAGLAIRAAQLARIYPNLGGGPIMGAALAHLEAGSPQMEELAIRQTQADVAALEGLRAQTHAQSGGDGFFLWNFFKGATRVVGLGFEFLWEEGLSRRVRYAVGRHQGMGNEEAWAAAGESDATKAWRAWRSGERVNLGSGFFAQSQLAPETERLLQGGVPLDQAAQNREQRQLGAPITQLGRQQRETGIQVTSPGGVKIPVSPGRLVALNFAEPGSTPFNLISGLTDLSANIFLDPANIALVGISELRRLSRVLVPDGVRPTILGRNWSSYLAGRDGQELINFVAGQGDFDTIASLLKGSANRVDPDIAAKLTRANSPAAVQSILLDPSVQARLRPETLNPVTLAGRLLRGGGTVLGKPVASGIGRYGVPAVVQAGIGAALGATGAAITGKDPLKGAMVGGALGGAGSVSGLTRIPGGGATGAGLGRLGGVGVAVSHNLRSTDSYLGWLAARTGSKGISIRDPHQGLEDFAEHMTLMRLPRVTRNELLLRLAEAKDMPTMYGAVRDAYESFAQILIREGLPEEGARALSAIYRREWEDFRAFWTNKAREPQYFPMASVKFLADGEVVSMPSAVLFSEFVNQMVPLLDARQIRGTLNRVRKMKLVGRRAFGSEDWQKVGENALTSAADWYMNRLWKPLVLLRIAWPLRVIGEEQLRMAAMGLNSAPRHPFQWLAMVMAEKKAEDLLGKKFVTKSVDESALQFQSAMSSRGLGFLDDVHVRNPHSSEFGKAGFDDPRFWEGSFGEVTRAVRDPLDQVIAQAALEAQAAARPLHGWDADFLKDIKDRFWNGDLAPMRKQLTRDGNRGATLGQRWQADGFIDTQWGRLNAMAGGNYYYLESGGVLPKGGKIPAGGRGGVEISTGQTVHSSGVWKDAFGREVDPNLIPHFSAFDADDVIPTGVFSPSEMSRSFGDTVGRALDEVTGQQVDLINWTPGGAGWQRLDDAFDEWADMVASSAGGRLSAQVTSEITMARAELHQAVTAHILGGATDPDGLVDIGIAMDRLEAVGTNLRRGAGNLEAREFIPSAEALRLAGIATDDFADIYGRLGSSVARFDARPLPPQMAGLPDGAHRVPNTISTYWIDRAAEVLKKGQKSVPGHPTTIIAVRDGTLVGQFTYILDAEGVRHIGILNTVPPTHHLYSKSDANRMLRLLLDDENPAPQSLLRLFLSTDSGRKVTVEQWLRAQSVDTSAYRTPEEVLDGIRARFGSLGDAGVVAPAGAESMSQAGATFAHLGLRRAVRAGADEPGAVAGWGQHRPQFVIPSPDDVIHPEILEAIAHGTFKGRALRDIIDPATGKVTTKSALRPGSRKYSATRQQVMRDLEETLGERMAGNFTNIPARPTADEIGLMERATNKLFDILMGKPTDKLSRSPAFQQFYWRRVSQLLPYLSEEDVGRALAQMSAQGVTRRTVREWAGDMLKGVPDGQIAQLERMAGGGFKYRRGIAPSGAIGFDEADTIAKSFALGETKELLYDITRKHNFFDITRHIFPFGEAWLEILSRWATITRQNPAVLRRLHQGITGGRESGFFYNDPSTGDEVFNYPGSDLISKWMFGDPKAVQFTGRLAGVNLMIGQYMPGVGPVIQIPASTMLRGYLEEPGHKFLRELLLPFGFTDIDSMGDVVDSLAPTWLRKALVSIGQPVGDDARVYSNTVIDVLRIMVANGQADISTPEGFEAGLDLAMGKARQIYRIRAISAFAGPTPAQVRFQQRDVSGQLWSLTQLSTEYRRILEEQGFSHQLATDEFVKLFGLEPSLYTTPKTTSLLRRSTTESGAEFEARNPELFKQFRFTAYYARADDPDEPFDYNAYAAQLRHKTRISLTPEQWTWERNDFLGRVAYERARRHIGDRKDAPARTWLRNYRLWLMERYDGYNSPVLGAQQRATRDQLIREFESWSSSPALQATDAGQGLSIYLEMRQRAIDEMVAMGYSPAGLATANAGKIYREWLRGNAEVIVARHPSFGPMWAEVWSREIEENELTEPSEIEVLDGIGFSTGGPP